LWCEREVREFNKVNYVNLTDTRKLLSNYNYNENLQYNNFNNILNDIKV
jgi:Ni,Fe-hydrogenase III component G